MEVIERAVRIATVAIQSFERPVQRNLVQVFQRTPPINHPVCLDLDLVELRIPDPSVFRPTHGSQIRTGDIRRRDENRPAIREERLVDIHVRVVRDIIPADEWASWHILGQRDLVDPLVGLVQDIDRAVPESPGILIGDAIPVTEHRTALKYLRAEPKSLAMGALPDQLAVVRDDQGSLVFGPRARRADEEVPVGCCRIRAVVPAHLQLGRMKIGAAECPVWPDSGGRIGAVRCRRRCSSITEPNGCKPQSKGLQPPASVST